MRYSLALACAMMATPIAAQELNVVTDTPVTHSIVSMVMGDLGSAELLLDRGGDPHSFQLRPSQARSLADADLIFWIGEELTPWMARALAGIEAQGDVVTLIRAEGLHLQGFAEGHSHDDHGHDDHAHGDHSHDNHGHDDHAHGDHSHDVHGHDDHAHGDHNHDDHGHDDHAHGDHSHDDHGHDDHAHGDHSHDDHGHDDHAHGDHSHDDHGHDDHAHSDHSHDDHGHDDHAHGDHSHDDHGHDDHAHGDHSHDDHGHSHDGNDPHVWMNTGNVAIWLEKIAEELGEHDPDNAAAYRANAEAALARIEDLSNEISSILEPASTAPLVMFHDAYGYLADQFGINVAGTIALGDAAAPGAQRLTELRADLQADGAVCIFPEVNHSSRYIDMVVEGTGVRVGAELDPAGVTLEPGTELYPTLMRNMAQAIADCVAG